jgi:hypothetical protein
VCRLEGGDDGFGPGFYEIQEGRCCTWGKWLYYTDHGYMYRADNGLLGTAEVLYDTKSNLSDSIITTTTRLHNISKPILLSNHYHYHGQIELMSNLNDQITLCNRIILDNKDSLDFTRYR